MKGIAFALDPDGYWIELVQRAAGSPVQNKYTLAQTMLRVKDPEKSLKFYRDICGNETESMCYCLTHLVSYQE